MPSFLVVRLGALGDIVHALPLAAALRARWPDALVDWIVESRHRALLDLVTGLDAVVTFDSRAVATSDGWIGAARRLRPRHYDVVFDAQGLIKSAAVARAAGGTRTVGFAREHLREPLARAFYSDVVAPAGATHVVQKNLSLLQAVGLAAGRPVFPLRDDPPVPGLKAAIDAVGRPFAVINPGGGWPNKRWPAERLGMVSAALMERHRMPSLVLWGPGDRALADEVVAASHGAARLAPQTTLADVVALLRAASLLVSGDTGPLHLAGAVGTPIVAIFGPTNPARNGPWDGSDISLSRFGDCVCHYQRRCRRVRGCIEDITVDDVRGAIDRRLAAPEHDA